MNSPFIGQCGGAFYRQAGTLGNPPPRYCLFWVLGVFREPSAGWMGLRTPRMGWPRGRRHPEWCQRQGSCCPTAAPQEAGTPLPSSLVHFVTTLPVSCPPLVPGCHQHHVRAGHAGHELPGGQCLHLHQRLHRQAGQLDPQQPLPAGGHRSGAGCPPGNQGCVPWGLGAVKGPSCSSALLAVSSGRCLNDESNCNPGGVRAGFGVRCKY